ncbi:unnamed protein product [Rotaria sp. Silwood2]|nr:unnamed protein product [Rotaria sp. Silwood2]
MAWNRLQKYCLELNVFATGSNDTQIILHQRWSTRVYIVLFAVVLIVVGTIAGFDVRSIDKIIGIAYETFVHTHVKFHHVCSSAFVTQAWINSIFLQKNHSSSSTYDIRYYLRYFWEIIAGFCSFSNSTWIDAVTSFGALRIVSPIAVVEENLRIQAQTTLDSSMSFAQTVLVRNLLAIRSIIAGNQFVSGLTTNYYLSYSPSGFGNEATPKMLPRTYNNCSCLNFRGCPHPIIINTSYHQLFTIPGMIGDCFIVDATMIRDHVRNFLSKIAQKMITLNLFKTNELQTPMNIRRQQILTRCFILLLVLCSITIGFYIFLSNQDQLVTIEYPSLSKYEILYEQHSSNLLCPCSQLSVSYGRFLNVTFVLHQICKSSLVSSMWLNYLLLVNLNRVPIWTETDFSRDFRTYGASYFQFLATYCLLAEINIEDAQRIFLSTQFINNYLPSQSLFFQQVKYISESFIAKTRHEFARTLNWTQTATMVSQFLTGANTNFHITVDIDGQVIINDVTFLIVTQITHHSLSTSGSCSCGFEDELCFLKPIIYTNGSNVLDFLQIFHELKIGCIPIFGLFLSEIDWWYNITYIENIRMTYSMIMNSQPSFDIKSLNRSVPTRFEHCSLNILLQEMFIETVISNNTRFDLFYEQCAPVACSYQVVRRREIIIAIILLINVYGGLSRGLRLIIPLIGSLIYFFIRKYQNSTIIHELRSIASRRKRFLNDLVQTILAINLFKSLTSDRTSEHKQKIYSRVYLILFISILGIVMFYSSIIGRVIRKTHLQPSIEDYEHLLNLHPDGVDCPCTRISIPYNTFVTQLKVDLYHQACTTDVIERTLIMGSIIDPATTYTNRINFQSWRFSFIDGLNRLCHLAEDSITNDIEAFLASTMLTYQLIPRIQFDNEMNITLNRVKLSTPIAFTRILELLRLISQANALIDVFSLSWNFVMTENSQGTNASFVSVSTNQYTTCSCATERSCSMPAQLVFPNGTSYYTFRGLVLGCFLLETILRSSLSCFYSMACIKEFRAAMDLYYPADLEIWSNETGIPVMLDARETRFSVTDTIETMAYSMFIESWTTNVSYENLFNTCAPNQCIYTYYYRIDALQLLTTFLSVFSALSGGLRFIVPYLVRIVESVIKCFRIIPTQ